MTNAILKVKTWEISKIKEAVFTVVFTVLAVYTPAIIHFFGGANAGQRFLPMPFFVILAGLLLGWRAGLATAIAAPLISFSISGMPVIQILPFVMLQLAVSGVVAGILRKKYGIFISLAAAIIAGWLAMEISLFIFSKMNAAGYLISGIKTGSPGIILQFVILPSAVKFFDRYIKNEK